MPQKDLTVDLGFSPEQQKVIDLEKKAWLLNGLTTGLFIFPSTWFVLVVVDLNVPGWALDLWESILIGSFFLSGWAWLIYEHRFREAKKELLGEI